MFEKIKQLQASGDLYTIVECGTAAIVSNTLMSVPGASAMISACLQPYSKSEQENFLGQTFKRSVSPAWVAAALERVKGPAVITQFQIQSEDIKTLTHGYIGVRGKHGSQIFHVSIYNNLYEIEYPEQLIDKRESYLKMIFDTVLELMLKFSVDPSHSIGGVLIDGVWDLYPESKVMFNLNQTLDILSNSAKKETMFVLHKGEWSRLEDLVRGHEGIIIERGSFNPIHSGHIELMDRSRAKYPSYAFAFLISMTNFDKPSLNVYEAIKRAGDINNLDYPVIFAVNPKFTSSSYTIDNRWPDLKVVYAVGLDTINRFVKDEVNNDKNLHERFQTIASIKRGKLIESVKEINWDVSDVYNTWKIFHGQEFENHKFLVFKRAGETLIEEAKYFAEIIEKENTWTDPNAISSTKIRKGEQVI